MPELKRAILVLELVSARVAANGDPPDEVNPEATVHKNNAIVATLKYPRSGAPSIVSSHEVNLKSGKETKFEGDFFSRGLFKEEIHGETELEVIITDRDEPNKLDKLLGTLFSTLMGMALGGVPTFVGAIGKAGVKAATDALSSQDADMHVIGVSTKRHLLRVDEIPETIEVELEAPKAIKRKVAVWSENKPPKIVQRTLTLVEQGAKSKVVLKCTEYPLP